MNNKIITKKIDLKKEVMDLKYKSFSKKNNKQTQICFKLSGFNAYQIEQLANRENISPNLYVKNLVLAFLEKQFVK